MIFLHLPHRIILSTLLQLFLQKLVPICKKHLELARTKFTLMQMYPFKGSWSSLWPCLTVYSFIDSPFSICLNIRGPGNLLKRCKIARSFVSPAPRPLSPLGKHAQAALSIKGISAYTVYGFKHTFGDTEHAHTYVINKGHLSRAGTFKWCEAPQCNVPHRVKFGLNCVLFYSIFDFHLSILCLFVVRWDGIVCVCVVKAIQVKWFLPVSGGK